MQGAVKRRVCGWKGSAAAGMASQMNTEGRQEWHGMGGDGHRSQNVSLKPSALVCVYVAWISHDWSLSMGRRLFRYPQQSPPSPPPSGPQATT